MIFGLLTAFFWGAADFLIKLLGNRLSLRGSIVWTQGIASLIVLSAILAEGRLPWATLDAQIAPMLIAAALSNAVGLGLLYAAFQNGRVAVVAPLIGSYAIVATGIGLVTGTEAVSMPLLLTLGLISFGALLVMIESGGARGLRPSAGAAAAIGSALASGLSIWLAASFVLPLVPMLDVLLSNFTMLGLCTLFWPTRERLALPQGRRTWLIVLGIAVGCVAGYGCYNNGLRQGGIAVVSVVATLSSAVTMLLASVVMKETVHGVQRIGLSIVILGLPVLAALREIGADLIPGQ